MLEAHFQNTLTKMELLSVDIIKRQPWVFIIIIAIIIIITLTNIEL